jgi:hypothetical protein
MAELFVLDNVRPEAILRVMFPVVSGASFDFSGNLRGIFSRGMCTTSVNYVDTILAMCTAMD